MNNDPRARPVARAHDVWKSFDEGRIAVLRGAHLSVKAGEMVALWGASGSGKSTLLHLLGGLDQPDRGEIEVCGLRPLAAQDCLALRRGPLGFVFQLHNLIPGLTAGENAAIPALGAGWTEARTQERLAVLFDRLGLGHRRDQRIEALSGGERQRVAIARALFLEPAVVLADEPTGALDERAGDAVFRLLTEVARAGGQAVVLATHERRYAEMCDRIVRVTDGHLQEL